VDGAPHVRTVEAETADPSAWLRDEEATWPVRKQ
jgi:hypothetical protein